VKERGKAAVSLGRNHDTEKGKGGKEKQEGGRVHIICSDRLGKRKGRRESLHMGEKGRVFCDDCEQGGREGKKGMR